MALGKRTAEELSCSLCRLCIMHTVKCVIISIPFFGSLIVSHSQHRQFSFSNASHHFICFHFYNDRFTNILWCRWYFYYLTISAVVCGASHLERCCVNMTFYLVQVCGLSFLRIRLMAFQFHVICSLAQIDSVRKNGTYSLSRVAFMRKYARHKMT